MKQNFKHPNDLLQIFKSSGNRYVYVCLVHVPEWQFYRMFPLALPITPDEMEQLLNNGSELVELDGDTLPEPQTPGQIALDHE